jgi:hypothetical protein
MSISSQVPFYKNQSLFNALSSVGLSNIYLPKEDIFLANLQKSGLMYAKLLAFNFINKPNIPDDDCFRYWIYPLLTNEAFRLDMQGTHLVMNEGIISDNTIFMTFSDFNKLFDSGYGNYQRFLSIFKESKFYCVIYSRLMELIQASQTWVELVSSDKIMWHYD